MGEDNKGHAPALEIYEHIVNKNKYVLFGKAMFKSGQTRKWNPIVLYTEYPAGEKIYAREEADFKRRFKKVHTPI